jgi:hypothetical protein
LSSPAKRIQEFGPLHCLSAPSASRKRRPGSFLQIPVSQRDVDDSSKHIDPLSRIVVAFDACYARPLLGARTSVEPTRWYSWQRPYELAILEIDRAKLPTLITAAQAAIDARIAEIQSMNNATADEWHAIEDARSGLRILIAETRSRWKLPAIPLYLRRGYHRLKGKSASL